MEKIRLNVIGLSYNPTQNGASALLLGEDDGPMRIPIIIGEAEAQAIITRFEGFTPRRPLTHDLIVSMLHRFGLTAIEVFIYKFDDGIFYCTLTLSDGNITSEIESRVSDAVAIALRTKTPIFTTREVIDQTGIILPSNQDNDDNNIDQSTNEHDVDSSIKRLQQQLENLIIDENYEEAARVKDEIARLKSSSPGDKTISDNDDVLPSLSDLIL